MIVVYNIQPNQVASRSGKENVTPLGEVDETKSISVIPPLQDNIMLNVGETAKKFIAQRLRHTVDESASWISLFQMDDTDLKHAFEQYVGSNLDLDATIPWNSSSFSDTDGVAMLRDCFMEMCTSSELQLKKIFPLGSTPCVFQIMNHGKIKNPFAILGWYPPKNSNHLLPFNNRAYNCTNGRGLNSSNQ